MQNLLPQNITAVLILMGSKSNSYTHRGEIQLLGNSVLVNQEIPELETMKFERMLKQ